MGSPVTPASWATAINETTATFLAIDMPIFAKGSRVYRIADNPAPGVAQGASFTIKMRPWTVVRAHELENVAATNTLQDQSKSTTPCNPAGAAVAPADFAVGFVHTASPAATTSATVTSRPWFYTLSDEVSGEQVSAIPQCLITDQASYDTYLAANLPGWSS